MTVSFQYFALDEMCVSYQPVTDSLGEILPRSCQAFKSILAGNVSQTTDVRLAMNMNFEIETNYHLPSSLVF